MIYIHATESEPIPVERAEDIPETLRDNSQRNLIWFHRLSNKDKENLVKLINPIHYASIYHEDLVKAYEEGVKNK